MRTAAQLTGTAAEDEVAAHLEAMGWRALARNVRVGRAELDLVALDPAPPAEVVVVEVRVRGRRDFGLPEETLDHAKRRTLRHAIATLRERGWLGESTSLPRRPIRFDLVALEPPGPHRPDAVPRLRHYRALPL